MSRHVKLLILIILMVAGLIGYALYLQKVEYLDPCPLCLTQRGFYLLIGVFALLALGVQKLRGVRISFYLLMAASAIGGIATAGRQVWLQHLPPEKVPECGPGLSYWLENMPLLKTVELLFKGDGNCAEVDWVFLGLSMAEWSLIMFVALLLACFWLLVTRPVRQ